MRVGSSFSRLLKNTTDVSSQQAWITKPSFHSQSLGFELQPPLVDSCLMGTQEGERGTLRYVKAAETVSSCPEKANDTQLKPTLAARLLLPPCCHRAGQLVYTRVFYTRCCFADERTRMTVSTACPHQHTHRVSHVSQLTVTVELIQAVKLQQTTLEVTQRQEVT